VRFGAFLNSTRFGLDFMSVKVLHSVARFYFLKKCTLIRLIRTNYMILTWY